MGKKLSFAASQFDTTMWVYIKCRGVARDAVVFLANRPLVLQYSSDTEDVFGIRRYRGLRTFALLDRLFLRAGPVAG